MKLKELLKNIFTDILFEYSKNDPIPELNRKQDGLGIFLLGPPTSGKGTFFRNFILPKQRNVKVFNSDDVSDLRRRDAAREDPSSPDYNPGVYMKGSSGLTLRKLGTYLQTGQNFVYDLTGNSPKLVRPVYESARDEGYDIIFIHILIPAKKAIKRVSQRNKALSQPVVDMEYVRDSYAEAQSLIKTYDKMNPDEYYLVVNVEDDTPIWMKYRRGDIYVRKGDKYVKR